MDAADAVLRFLESTGRRGDAEFYLRIFRAEAKERFATIAVNAQVAKIALDAVIVDLRFLAALGLTPVVVLGLIEPGEADEHASRVRRRLERQQVPAVVLPDDGEDLAARAAAAARAGIIPVIPFDAADGSSVDQRFERLAGLIGGLRTRKLLFLNRTGALQTKAGAIDIVNLSTEYEPLVASRELSKKQQALLSQCRQLVFGAPHKLLVSITSPIDLLRELFTARGAGTLLRRGAVIETKTSYADVDRSRLAQLVESAFGRAPVEGFFERPVTNIFLEDSYRGAALVVRTELGGYLTKFAVEREAQGEGIGRDLWERMNAEYPRVFWRARPNNPINAWYTQQADGLSRFPDWHVFWRGLAPESIPAAIAYSLAAPVDIPPAASATE
jgi:GNAT superfamily N-acetyltransferase